MNVTTKKLACVMAALLSTVVFSAPAFSADVMLGTGGYNKQMHKLEMMKMLDADGDHKVTKDEFINFHKTVFKSLDKSGDEQLDPQEWLAKHVG